MRDPTDHGFVASACLLTPQSRGSVPLALQRPDRPSRSSTTTIYAERARTCDGMVEGLRLRSRSARTAGAASPTAASRSRRPTSDDDDDAARARPRATARRSTTRSARARWATPWSMRELRVNGVEGLRVVDASVMPTVVARQHERADDHDRRAGRGPDPRAHARAGRHRHRLHPDAGSRPADPPRAEPRSKAAPPGLSIDATPGLSVLRLGRVVVPLTCDHLVT